MLDSIYCAACRCPNQESIESDLDADKKETVAIKKQYLASHSELALQPVSKRKKQMFSHSRENTFQCPLCERIVLTRDNLQIHLRHRECIGMLRKDFIQNAKCPYCQQAQVWRIANTYDVCTNRLCIGSMNNLLNVTYPPDH